MNKLTLIVPALLILSGCKSTDISRAVKDGINGAINSASSTTNQAIMPSSSKTYTTTEEKIYTYKAEKESRDFGNISLAKTAVNPTKQTRVLINQCLHPRVGEVKCEAYMHEISPEGWIVDSQNNKIYLEKRSRYNDKVVPAGNYYMKVKTKGVAKESYAVGDITIMPFVTNYVDITFE
ncbi:hypothetical protein LOC50_05360 [Pseudoalteromonas sp. SCSIO 43095]|uniref:hypothetical protein n=1 Tax=Pseudoalteromonas sp. SCSIO 43095 TaxID=2894202 RepID=UPI00202B4DAF|nr:hypothetical protein [Pseudoalteromonas sp. SCSIO 43095]MDX1727848.1 hypothetical protein [Pseudoalteromonas tetraodonis]URQ99709.1 hypothetical protein LOC50_05360 [Pseudoalteromonas sp. SCSIO 43095]